MSLTGSPWLVIEKRRCLNLEAFLGKSSMTVKGLRRAHSQDQTSPTWQTLGTNAKGHARMSKEGGGRCCPAGIFWGNNQEGRGEKFRGRE